MNHEFKCKSCNPNDNYGLQDVNNQNIGTKCKQFKVVAPPQQQPSQPGVEYVMNPLPIFDNPNYVGSGKLNNKVAIITGGDSGIGRSVAVHFAKEGAIVVIVYLNEHEDAKYTKQYIENLGGICHLIDGDLTDPEFCKYVVNQTVCLFGTIDILVNNAGTQFEQLKLEDISNEQFDFTFKSNIYSMFYLTKYALPHMKRGSIINTASITTFIGEPTLIDYTATKGAIIGFTRALATNLATKGIRVNAVAPGVFWTPLQPACWEANKIPTLGSDSDMRRMANPYEIAPMFVYLASDQASYTTGQVMHVNGGQYKG